MQTSLAERGALRRFGAVPAAVLLAVCFALPLAALVGSAFTDGGRAFGAVLRDPLVADAIAHSLALAVGAGTLSVGVGVPVAFALAGQSPARRHWTLALLGVPLAFSGLVIAYGFILAFGRAGFVTTLAASLGADPTVLGGAIYTMPGLAVAYAYYLIPRVALMIYPALANLDRRPLEAALTLGARPWRAWLDVAWRELWPSVASAWCLVTAIALGTYGTALALAGTQINILPLLMYLKLSDGQTDFSQAAVLSIVLTAICTCVLALGKALYGNDVMDEWSEAACDALAQLAQRQRGTRRHRMPVGVIGPREATDEQMRLAQRIAHALAAAGVAIVGGGKQGVMEAAARGVHAAGGCAIGLLPEDDATLANPYLSVALPTGLGITRNALVARASLCLIAVGGGLGTLSRSRSGCSGASRCSRFATRRAWRAPSASTKRIRSLRGSRGGWPIRCEPAAGGAGCASGVRLRRT